MRLKLKSLALCIALFAFVRFDGFGQFDFVITALNLKSNAVPHSIEGRFEKKIEPYHGGELEYYDFSNPNFDLCYYPKQLGVNCGYFTLNDQLIVLDGKYPYNLGCDLDYGSFEVFECNINKNRYLILTCIRYGSGTTTRNVYCNLFDITDPLEVQFFPLWSIYGSSHCFGDYNADGKIDFLEIRYDPEAKSTDIFKLTLTTLDMKEFRREEDKYIIFRREYQREDIPRIITIEKNW